jgi:hypothetical protein
MFTHTRYALREFLRPSAAKRVHTTSPGEKCCGGHRVRLPHPLSLARQSFSPRMPCMYRGTWVLRASDF